MMNTGLKQSRICKFFARIVGLACVAVGGARAADWPGEGKYVAADASAFVNAEDPSTPFALGEGMLLYTGPSAVVDVPISLNVATGTGANTFNVQNADTTLTLAGAISQTRGNFIKTGPGTLAFTYPGYQQIAPGPSDDGAMNRDTRWDETTGACTNGGFTRFTLDQGQLVFGAPGQTNYVRGMSLIGNRSQNKVRLAVTNGVFQSAGNWFCLARGTGQTTNDASSELYVGKDAIFTAQQLNLGYANGVGSAYPRAKLIVDGGSASIGNDIYALETGSGKAEVVVTNGGTFVSQGWNARTTGWQMQNGDGGSSAVTVSGRSTARAHYLGMRGNSTLLVNDGSSFVFDRMLPANASLASIGTATFDGATLGAERSGDSLWFNCMNAGYYGCNNGFTVGANGLVFDVPTNASAALYPRIATASGATASDVVLTKKGGGSVAICLPCANKLVVEEGDLRLRNRMPNVNQVPSQTPTVAAGSKLVAAGEEAFANLTIPAGTPVVLRAQGIEMEKGRNWACNGWSAVRPDGLISLTDSRAASVGSAFHKNKVDVSKSFRLTFDIGVYAPGSIWWRDGGMAVVLCANTPWVVGNGGYNDIGYYNGSFTNAANKSVAFGFHSSDLCLSYGENGKKVGDTVPLRMVAPDFQTTLDTSNRATLGYDAATGNLSLTVKFRCGVSRTITRTVDLAAVLGASSAYLGFTASTQGGGPVDYLVSDVAFSDRSAPVAMRTGGNVTATSATPLSAQVVADEGDPALMMKSIAYSDGAVLDIGTSGVGGTGEICKKLLLDQSAGWSIGNGAHWNDAGTLALSSGTPVTNAAGQTLYYTSGYAYSPGVIDFNRNWSIDFDYAFGQKGGGVKADAFSIGFVTATRDTAEVASTGFEVECRYYLSGTPTTGSWNSTRLLFYKNGSLTPFASETVPDCAPVRLYDTEAAHVTLTYAKDARTFTVTLVDAKGTFTKTLSDFDMKGVLDGSPTAFLRFQGQVGGSWTENVVSNFKFAADVDRSMPSGALGFDAWNGSGTVVKRGSGSLAVVSNSAANVSVKIEEGGLYLAKEGVNDYADTGRGGWLRSDKWLVGDGCRGGVLVGAPSPTKDNHDRACNVHFGRRLPMGRSWTFSADCYALGFQDWATGAQTWPGNALTIYAHNDPRGLSYTGSSGNSGGFNNSVKNGWALNFFTYSDATTKQRFCWTTGGARYTTANVSASFAPVAINNDTTTHFDIVHDAAAKTVKVTLTRGTNASTNTFSDVDIKSCLGGDEMAWFGLGCGGGWAHGMFDWHNVRLTFPDGADADQSLPFLKAVEITAAESPVFIDSRRTNGVYRLAPTVNVAAGSVLLARSVTLPATLTMGTLTLGAGAIVGGDADTVVKPDTLASADGDLHVETTTFAFGSSRMNLRDLYLTDGAKVRLDFTGVRNVKHVYVDGVRQVAGDHSAASWIATGSTGRLVSGFGMSIIVR